MASFTDREHREWRVEITVATLKRVKLLCDYSLGSLLNDDMALLNKILSDPEEVANVVYAICQPEAEKRGINEEQFGESLAGESMEACIDAFIQAVIDFFPSRQSRVLKIVVQKTNQMADALAEAVEQKVNEHMQATLTKLASG